MILFEGQPSGTGPFFHRAVLHFRLCTQVHYARCALPGEKMAAGDGHQHRVYRPCLVNGYLSSGVGVTNS